MTTFGILHDFRQPLPHRLATSRYYGECLDEVAAAEDLGFEMVWLGEHHFTEDGFLPSPLVVAGAIAARTARIGIGTNILVLPLHDPLRVAEDAAVVDQLSGGRFTLGVGQGYAPVEFQGFGARRAERAARLEEGLVRLRAAWGQPIAAGADGVRGAVRVPAGGVPRISPPPAHRIPVYVGAVAERAVDRAVRLADGLLTYVSRCSEHAPRWRTLQTVLQRCGRPAETFAVVGSTFLYVDEDEAAAWATAGPALSYYEDTVSRLGADQGRTAELPEHPEDYLIGTPSQVIDRLAGLLTASPYDHLCFWARPPGVSHQAALRSIELFSTQVRPRLIERLPH
jgi:alkanesulfonate monooxygenase SsuD/methylene tetrahydromethanopterin reductase-like flavin-dependent oxidoreductase (luciferase family)